MKTNDQESRPAVVFLWGLFVLGAFLILWLAPKLRSTAPSAEPETAAPAGHINPQEEVMAAAPSTKAGRRPGNWGIEVIGLYPAVGGRILNLRYKILDTAKAALLANETGPMYLIDEETGTAFRLANSPRTGTVPQHPQRMQAGRNYSLNFPNPGKRFRSGSKLTLVIGALRAENLTVQ